MSRIISYAEAVSRVGNATDSISFTVAELQNYINQTNADNIRLYFYKSNPAGRTNFIISGYDRGVEETDIFFGDIESQTNPVIVIEETDSVFVP